MTDDNSIQIYQSPDGETCVDVRFEKETVWLTQAQMVALFHRDVSVISRHIKNAVHEGEINEKSNLQKMQIARSDKPVTLYDLEVVISVGYRVKSTQGVQFRRWATQRLRDYLIKGYTINQQRFEENATELKQALALIQKAAKSPVLATDMGRGLVDIMGRYTQTFLWLQQYDEGLLKEPGGRAGGTLPTPKSAMTSIFELKNHPFTDGNKRSGAFLFIDFLHRNGCLINTNGQPVINETGLAALTLLVAESDPTQKETLIKLIMNLLCKPES